MQNSLLFRLVESGVAVRGVNSSTWVAAGGMMFLMRVGRASWRRVVRALVALTGATIVSFILAGIVLFVAMDGGELGRGNHLTPCETREGLDGLLLVHAPEGVPFDRLAYGSPCVVPTGTVWGITWLVAVIPFIVAGTMLGRPAASRALERARAERLGALAVAAVPSAGHADVPGQPCSRARRAA